MTLLHWQQKFCDDQMYFVTFTTLEREEILRSGKLHSSRY